MFDKTRVRGTREVNCDKGLPTLKTWDPGFEVLRRPPARTSVEDSSFRTVVQGPPPRTSVTSMTLRKEPLNVSNPDSLSDTLSCREVSQSTTTTCLESTLLGMKIPKIHPRFSPLPLSDVET